MADEVVEKDRRGQRRRIQGMEGRGVGVGSGVEWKWEWEWEWEVGKRP